MKNSNIPAITRSQMAEIDASMIHEYGINLLQMMENAGRNLADLCRRKLSVELEKSKILVVCGGGNNGGGGMAAARHLYNWGAHVTVALATELQTMKDAPKHQMLSLKKIGLIVEDVIPSRKYQMVVDALIGYGLRGSPQGMYAKWIEWINNQDSPRISLDIPSGLDADSGKPSGVCVKADATLTLALPKVGMMTAEAKKYVGELYLADISVPKTLIRRFIGNIPDFFVADTIVKIL